MMEAIEFCKMNDLQEHNWVRECIEDGLIRAENENNLSADDKRVIENRKVAYYNTNWQKILMTIFRFKRP